MIASVLSAKPRRTRRHVNSQAPPVLSQLRSTRLTPEQWATVDAFHRLYYEARLVGASVWMGTLILKTPLDLWAYQEVIHATRPDTIIETGTAWGGSALYFASLCDLMGHGRVISVDRITDIPALYRWAFGANCEVPTAHRPVHPRITYITGDVLVPAVRDRVAAMAHGTVMLSLDSHHDADHVLAEVRLWSPLVTPGGYCVVEDTNMGGHPVQAEPWHGPYDAAVAFLRETQDFVLDHSMTERFLMSYNTWLLRK